MRQLRFAIALIVVSSCAGGAEIAEQRQPLAAFNAGPNTCTGYGMSSTVPGVFDCRIPTDEPPPISPLTCPAAQWRWNEAPGGYSSTTGNPKGNAYCEEYPYTGQVDWGRYPGERIARVQEIGGLWVPTIGGATFNGCGKNIRVCLGPPTQPASTAAYGVRVPGCSDNGPGGCAVCSSVQFRAGEVTQASDTCCTKDHCLRHTLTLTKGDEGAVSVNRNALTCAGLTCTAEYSDLAVVTLTRTDGHVDWTGWTGACTGLADTCTVSMNEERSVEATYLLGGTVAGALAPADGVAPLPRDHGTLLARQASSIRIAMAGSGYTFAHDGVCDCFVPDGDGFLCGRPTAGSGTITVTHVASGASRLLEVAFVAPPGAGEAQISLGQCRAAELAD